MAIEYAEKHKPVRANIDFGRLHQIYRALMAVEKMIGDRMNIGEFIMCTDAGLSSGKNRLYNDIVRCKLITVHTVRLKSTPRSAYTTSLSIALARSSPLTSNADQ